MKKSLLTLFALLCVVMQGLWAQEPTPSTVAASLACRPAQQTTQQAFQLPEVEDIAMYQVNLNLEL